jgi:hypothetical protein
MNELPRPWAMSHCSNGLSQSDYTPRRLDYGADGVGANK